LFVVFVVVVVGGWLIDAARCPALAPPYPYNHTQYIAPYQDIHNEREPLLNPSLNPSTHMDQACLSFQSLL
jgi:hypothetical protein